MKGAVQGAAYLLIVTVALVGYKGLEVEQERIQRERDLLMSDVGVLSEQVVDLGGVPGSPGIDGSPGTAGPAGPAGPQGPAGPAPRLVVVLPSSSPVPSSSPIASPSPSPSPLPSPSASPSPSPSPSASPSPSPSPSASPSPSPSPYLQLVP